MQSDQTEFSIKDNVVRARHAFWYFTTLGEAIDLTRFARIKIVELTRPDKSEAYAVAAFPDPDDFEIFDLLYENEFLSAAEVFFNTILRQLINAPSVH